MHEDGRSSVWSRVRGFGVVGVLVGLTVASCSGTNGVRIAKSQETAAADSGTSGAGSLQDQSPDAGSCSASEPGQGCPCAMAGDTVACWTGPADQRNVGACHDGTRHCMNYGEFLQWSGCGGQQLNCGGAGAGSGSSGGGAPVASGDAGSMAPVATGDAGGKPPAPTAEGDGGMCSASSPECIPGTTRYCDDGSCYWGTETCGPDGNWDGDCEDTPGNQGPSGCQGISYDENCCVQSGACCAHAVGGDNGGSVGSCGGVAPCDSCATLCVAGAVRWCSVPTGGDYDVPDMGPWGQQTCASDGTWGACAASTSAPTGCSSSSSFDSTCCQASGQCCEAFDFEDADPVSVNCPVPSCVPRAPSPGGGDQGGLPDAGFGGGFDAGFGGLFDAGFGGSGYPGKGGQGGGQ
jgi:hypothetical protein